MKWTSLLIIIKTMSKNKSIVSVRMENITYYGIHLIVMKTNNLSILSKCIRKWFFSKHDFVPEYVDTENI